MCIQTGKLGGNVRRGWGVRVGGRIFVGRKVDVKTGNVGSRSDYILRF